MRSWFKAVLVVGVSCLLAGGAAAQFMGFPITFMLQHNPALQKELKLTEEQLAKIKELTPKIQEKFKADFEKVQKLDEKERPAKQQEVAKAMRQETFKALADVLKPEQMKRFKQIDLQQRGDRALNDEEVQQSLKLSDEQKSKIKSIREAHREAFAKGMKENPMEFNKKIQAMNKETSEKVKGVLTDEQKKALQELMGEPFHPAPAGK